MKIVVFGSTGGIGKLVVEQALAAGHEVTAVARRPEAITIKNPRLKVVQGDAMKPETLETAIAGRDVVVSALGVTSREPTTLYSQGDTNILKAMDATGTRRFFCISATGIEPGPVVQKVVARLVLWNLLKEMYSDLVRMETAVKKSDLDWTIVRPPRLNDKPRTGKYVSAINKHLPSAWEISRADLADYILTHLDSRDTFRATVEVAN